MSHEAKKPKKKYEGKMRPRKDDSEEDEMPMPIRMTARCGRRGTRINRRFRPDTLLDRLTDNPFPRKSVFTAREPTFKDTEGRKYYRATSAAIRKTEKEFTRGWYYLVLPVRRSVEDAKVTWPGDDSIFAQNSHDWEVHVYVQEVQKSSDPKTVVARVFLDFVVIKGQNLELSTRKTN